MRTLATTNICQTWFKKGGGEFIIAVVNFSGFSSVCPLQYQLELVGLSSRRAGVLGERRIRRIFQNMFPTSAGTCWIVDISNGRFPTRTILLGPLLEQNVELVLTRQSRSIVVAVRNASERVPISTLFPGCYFCQPFLFQFCGLSLISEQRRV